MRRVVLLLGLLTIWTPAMTDAVQAALPPPPSDLSKCQTCHGPDGDSSSAAVPRLNGQQYQYLGNRLRSFSDPTRQSAHATYSMWSVNSRLSDAAVAALAQYFSAQPPPALAPMGKLAEQGRKLYENGDGPQLPACQNCHGAGAEGKGIIPRLAGQHAQYLRQQMESFLLRTRVNETMNPHSRMLTHEQILALVAYLAKD